MPQVTSAGQNYVFPTLDPTYMDETSTTFFDKFFPFLRDETIQSRGYLLVLDVSKWFTNTTQVTYTMNSTDNSGNPPFWMSLDPYTGKLILDPPSDLPS
jgi:GR25 family glycosyltransferase involved in LPS biosynthesis